MFAKRDDGLEKSRLEKLRITVLSIREELWEDSGRRRFLPVNWQSMRK